MERFVSRASVCLALALSTVAPAVVAENPPVLLEAHGLPRASASDEAIAERMNPFVLTDLVSERLVLEVDWVAGYRPSPLALQAAEETLRESCVEGRRIEITMDDEIPLDAWHALSGDDGPAPLTARFLDGDPTDWQHTELVHVLYVPDARSWYDGPVTGITDRVTLERPSGPASVSTVLLFTDRIRKNARLWIAAKKVERATLVHELGHVFGLVADPARMQPDHPGHCRSSRCVMHRAGWRGALVNAVPSFFAGRVRYRFGERCREDITTAKRVWARRVASSTEFARKLEAQRLLRESRRAAAWRTEHGSP